jgi:hypothetical protein
VIDHQVGRPLLKSTKGVLVVAHDTLWRQSFNYKTPSRVAAIANPLNYLPADNNIAIRVAGDYPRTYYIDEFLWFFLLFFVHDFYLSLTFTFI